MVVVSKMLSLRKAMINHNPRLRNFLIDYINPFKTEAGFYMITASVLKGLNTMEYEQGRYQKIMLSIDEQSKAKIDFI